MKTQIPAPRVPFVDLRTGLITREWYIWLLDVFGKIGGGNSTTTIPDIEFAATDAQLNSLGNSQRVVETSGLDRALFRQEGDTVGISPPITVEPVFPFGKFGTAENRTAFDVTGHQTMAGLAKPWDDIRIEPVARSTGTGAPTFEKWFDDVAGTSAGVWLYSFTDESVAGNEKQIFFTLQMPHSWDGGPVNLHVHWTPSTTVVASDVLWGLEYCWADIGESFTDTTAISASTLYPDDTNITAGKHYISPFASITPGSSAEGLSSILIGRLFRNSSAAADTYTSKVGLLYIDAHFQMSSLGSTDEYIK